MRTYSKALAAAIASIRPALGGAQDTPAMQGALVRDGRMTAYNLRFGISVPLEEGEAPFILPAQALELIPKLPRGDVEITVGKVLQVACGGVSAEYAVLDPVEFPEIGQLEAEPVEVDADWLTEALGRILHATPKVDLKPAMMGARFDCSDGRLNLVCTDGYRLALESCAGEGLFSFTVPTETARAIVALGLTGRVEITADRRQAVFDDGKTRVFTRLLEGEFLDWRGQNFNRDKSFSVDRKELLGALDRIKIAMGKQKHPPPVRVQIGRGSLVLSIPGAVSAYREELEAACDDDMEIWFNRNYLRDAVAAVGSDTVDVGYGRQTELVVMRDGDFTAVVLPVRIQKVGAGA